MRDLYEVLGVRASATADEIKKAYRKLAQQVPPRQQPGRREGRGALQGGLGRLRHALGRREAQGLRPVRRVRRRRRAAASTRAAFRDYAQRRGLRHLATCSATSFGRVRGGRRRRPRPAPRAERGRDLRDRGRPLVRRRADGRRSSTIPVEKDVDVPRPATARGAAPGHQPDDLPRVRRAAACERADQGFFSLSEPCPRCGGAGTVIEKPCPTCHGRGRARARKRYAVRDPGRRQGRRRHPAARQGRRRRGGRPGRRPARARAASSRRRSSRGAATTSCVDVPVLVRRGRARRRDRGADARRRAASSVKVPARHRRRQAAARCAAAARRCGDSDGSGDLLARVDIVVPKKLTSAQKRGAREVRGARRRRTTSARRPLRQGRRRRHDRRTDSQVHDRRRRPARRHAPADAAAVRGARARRAAPHAGRHAPLLRRATSRGCARSQQLASGLGLSLQGVEHVLALEDAVARARATASRGSRRSSTPAAAAHARARRRACTARTAASSCVWRSRPEASPPRCAATPHRLTHLLPTRPTRRIRPHGLHQAHRQGPGGDRRAPRARARDAATPS